MSDAPGSGWNLWLTPGVIVASLVAGGAFLSSRFATIEDRVAGKRGEAVERRVGESNQRIDRVLENQATASAQLGRVENELN